MAQNNIVFARTLFSGARPGVYSGVISNPWPRVKVRVEIRRTQSGEEVTQKYDLIGYSQNPTGFGFVYVIPCLAVLVEHQFVTDRQTRTEGHSTYRSNIASCSNNVQKRTDDRRA